MKCGIVGLPNVGKSTLFNALTQTAAAQASNYPFCTIEPNTGTVCVPDQRLQALAERDGSRAIVPTQLTFVDIAGLVRGASSGEGLGNKFLGHIRGVDAIIQVVRCFHDDNITHVGGVIDPLSDIGVVETELLLADLQSLETRLGRKKKEDLHPLLTKAHAALQKGQWARTIAWEASEHNDAKHLDLLTAKPVIYVCNIGESNPDMALVARVQEYVRSVGCQSVVLCNELEAQIAQVPEQERQELLESMGMTQTGLATMVRAAYDVLGLITFFTSGPKEVHAWTVREGACAPEAAGVIHTDFQKGFIRAEVVEYADYIACGTDQAVRDEGKKRVEGKEYRVKDGDVMHFLFNV
jgi:GTP-binding protein YchF